MADKSDIWEAVLQIVILKILYESGVNDKKSIVQELQKRLDGIADVQPESGHIAILKLESSGWIKRKPTSQRAGFEMFELTSTASIHLWREMREWSSFLKNWQKLGQVLGQIVIL